MGLMERIRENASRLNKKIILPEGTEERTLKAANQILEQKIAQLILLGNPDEIEQSSWKYSLKFIDQATIIDPKNNPDKEFYSEFLYNLRKEKGLNKEQAIKLAEDPLYLAILMIKNKKADGEVAGASNSTGNVLKPAFQIIKTLPGVNIVSGVFFMTLNNNCFGENGLMVFADCAVNPNPTASELAEIAVLTAKTAKAIANIEPRVAMLSFSTKGSAKHPMVEKVTEATQIAKKLDPSLKIDGELQADAAIIESIGKSKAPGSEIAGKANILIFPTLETGNIAYKLVQRLTGAEAVGPVLQGMAAPINDLSRGCSVEDIINLVAITATQIRES